MKVSFRLGYFPRSPLPPIQPGSWRITTIRHRDHGVVGPNRANMSAFLTNPSCPGKPGLSAGTSNAPSRPCTTDCCRTDPGKKVPGRSRMNGSRTQRQRKTPGRCSGPMQGRQVRPRPDRIGERRLQQPRGPPSSMSAPASWDVFYPACGTQQAFVFSSRSFIAIPPRPVHVVPSLATTGRVLERLQ